MSAQRSHVLLALWLVAGCGRIGFSHERFESPGSIPGSGSMAADSGSDPTDASSPLADTGADSGTIDPLSVYDDDFNGTALGPQWMRLHEDRTTATVQGGELNLLPVTLNSWFRNDETGLFHLPLRGNVAMTARASVRKVTVPSEPVDPQWRFGGIIARDPSGVTEPENHILMSFGADASQRVAESKTTVDGASSLMSIPWPSNDGDLRICRVGSQFQLLARETDWQIVDTVDRPDLPDELQWGMFVEQFSSGAVDVQAFFDRARFRTPSTLADCVAP